MQTSKPKPIIVLLIDAETTCPEGVELVLLWLERWKGPVIKRAYGEWEQPYLQHWDALVAEHEIRLVLTESDSNYIEDFLEMRIEIDAACMLQGHGITRFCIVTSNSDLIPLIQSLRQAGATVCGFGGEDAPRAHLAVGGAQGYSEWFVRENRVEPAIDPGKS